jgi:hypothetical protein
MLVGIFLLICGISAASFAVDKNRSQAAWLVIGIVLGPIGLLDLLMLGDLEQPARARRIMLAAITMFVTLSVLGLGLIEINAQYHEKQRQMYLERWEIYGDALLRFSEMNRQSPDVLTVKLARDQIRDYREALEEAVEKVESDLALAMDGYRKVSGIRAFVINLLRVITLRSPMSPARTSLSVEEQEKLVADLEKTVERYRHHLKTIESHETHWR